MHGLLGLVHRAGSLIPETHWDRLQAEFMPGADLHARSYVSEDSRCHLATLTAPAPSAPAMSSRAQNSQCVVLLDGELYDEDLRGPNQAEMLLAAYRHEGDVLFSRLNGSFALAIYHITSERLILVSDRSASQPIFFIQTARHFAFSTRMRPLVHLPEMSLTASPAAVADFLASGFVLKGGAIAEGIELLGPGEMLILTRSELSRQAYRPFALTPQGDSFDSEGLSQELARLIQQAMGRRIREDLNFGVMLSGGYDSRVIAGCMRKFLAERPISTITWGIEEQRSESDAVVASQIAAHIQARHVFYKLEAAALPEHFRAFVALNEGRTDAVGNYPEALRIFERVRDELNVEVLFRGDECFGWREDVTREADMLHSLSIHDLSRLQGAYNYLKPEIHERLKEAGHSRLREVLSSCPHDGLHDRKDYLYFTQRLFGYLNALSQLKQLVLDLRNPFLDSDILDFIETLPTSLRLGKALFKQTIGRLFPEFDKFGFAKYNSLINWDERIGFDRQLQDFIRHELLSKHNGFDDLVDRKKLAAFLERSFADAANSLTKQNGRRLAPIKRMRRRLQRRRGIYDLRPCTQIFRLLILKIWADEYAHGAFNLA